MEVDKNLIKSWESVSKEIDPEHPDRIIFKFGTYGWSFPSQFKDGIHKNGITKEIKDPGTKRMTEACSGKKTAIPEEPFVVPNSEIVWTIPFEISNGLLTEANKFARKFDIECNKALAKYKVKLSDQRMVGEEWYRLTVPQATKIREGVWKKLIGRELAKKENEAKKVRTRIQLKKGLQEKAHQAVLDELKKGTERFKGIAPTGFGKTVLAWKIFTDAYAKKLIKGKVSIMTAPSQFLCNKNSVAFDTYNSINGITGIVNQPIFSGEDVGVFDESVNQFEERKSRLGKLIAGHLSSGNRVILHVCINSMKLVDEVLDTLGIPSLDLMIVDEAHTLASHRDNNDKSYLGTVRNFCLFDENIKVSHRFFLTATEKNLVNPDILSDEQIFAYMNNKDYFGDYAFKFSYAECVVDGLIVPFRCKVFEYSDVTKDVVKMMKLGIDRFLLDDLALKDNEGDIGQVSVNLIRVLVSSLKVIQERNKMLLIVNRNAHADLLEKAFELLQNDPNYAFLQGVNINKITTPYYPKPAARQDELEIIHESDEKHIIICGPWSITGTDCPSIDAVLWGYLPGTEISAAQGTGRGTRTHTGKNDLLVAFNLDLGTGLADLKNDLLRTIAKLHEGLFPSHDLQLAYKVKKVLGRTFNEVEKDKEAVVKPEVRKLLDDFYEAATDVELFDFVRSPAFLNGGKPDYYTFDEIHKIAVDSPSITLDHFFNEYVPSLNDPKIYGQFFITSSEEYKKIGPIVFLGMEKYRDLEEKLFIELELIVSNCINKNLSYRETLSEIKKEDPWNGYFPYRKSGGSYVENPNYNKDLYIGWRKGFPICEDENSFYLRYTKRFGNLRERFISDNDVKKLSLIKDGLFERMNLFVIDCSKKGYSSRYAKQEIINELNRYCPYIRRSSKEETFNERKKDFVDNPNYDPLVYSGLKDGFPLASIYNSLMVQFEEKYGKVSERLSDYMTEKEFESFLISKNITKLFEFKEYCENNELDILIKIRIPNYRLIDKVYDKEFLEKVLERKKDYEKWDLNKTISIKNELEILSEKINPGRGRDNGMSSICKREMVDNRFIKNMFILHKLDVPNIKTSKVDKIDRIKLKSMLESGSHNYISCANFFGTSQQTIRRTVEKLAKMGFIINYDPKHYVIVNKFK
jgi:superfamily II DNA or RNA helicase